MAGSRPFGHAEGMDQGIAPAVDPFQGMVISAVDSLSMLPQQGGLGELVTTTGG